MTQTADADDTDAVGRFYVVLDNWIENRYAPAEKWPGLLKVQRIRKRLGPDPMSPHTISEPAVSVYDGRLVSYRISAQIMIARENNNGTTCNFRKTNPSRRVVRPVSPPPVPLSH